MQMFTSLKDNTNDQMTSVICRSVRAFGEFSDRHIADRSVYVAGHSRYTLRRRHRIRPG